jgi:hypothetical protein
LMLFNASLHPRKLPYDNLKAALAHVAMTEYVAASTQNEVPTVPLFPYQPVLGQTLSCIRGLARVRNPNPAPCLLMRVCPTPIGPGPLAGHRRAARRPYETWVVSTAAGRCRTPNIRTPQPPIEITAPTKPSSDGALPSLPRSPTPPEDNQPCLPTSKSQSPRTQQTIDV